ncbi:MAG: ABC transporter ATP-binding protein [Rubricoccaceae bacterium]
MRYGHRRLFEDLSFEVNVGEPLAILGANGSGKSTLLRILSGVLEPTAGEARIETTSSTATGIELTTQVGFVAPALQMYDAFSARENLDFLARARRLRDGSAALERVLDRVGLADRADDLVATYSTGMRQRLRLAGALLHNPPVLLLDEPGATLDGPGRALVSKIFALTDRILVVATNDPAEAERCPRRVTLM